MEPKVIPFILKKDKKRIFGNVRVLKMLSITAFCTMLCFGCSDTTNYDIIIENGTIIDGTGSPGYEGDIGIVKDRIIGIGDLSKAKADKRIDAEGLIVAPGFIDAHNHTNRAVVNKENSDNKIYVTQGVTTCVYGVDGYGTHEEMKKEMDIFSDQGVGTNYVYFMGHNGIRRAVLGMENRAPTSEELKKMKEMVQKGMDLGAIGLSSGLMYLPGGFATTEEVIALAEVAGKYDGVYDSHIRDPVNDLLPSIIECLEIGQKSGARAHPGHHKAPGKNNWGKAKEAAKYIKEMIDQGYDITVDQYPYDGAMVSQLINTLVLPQGITRSDLAESLRDSDKLEQIRALTENPGPDRFSWVKVAGYNSFRIVNSKEFPQYVGKLIADIAEEKSIDPFDLLVEIILAEGNETMITLGACLEEDVQYILTRPWTIIGSDGGYGMGHPRAYGTFPRVLGWYARELKLLTLEEAIHKMTGQSAKFYKLSEVGTIKEGYFADITIFNPETVIDKADWQHPNELSEGIVYVLVGGIPALEDGKMTANLNGRFMPFDGGKFIKK